MSENVIFCFSGTGNCLDLAKNIAHTLGDTDIISLRRAPTVTDARGCKRVGFIFPCYGGGLPDGVEESLRSLQLDKDSYKFAVCSCAAYPGIGLSIVNRMFPLDYWAVVSHQCSCVWLFPHQLMLPPLKADAAQRRSERLAKEIGSAVKELKRKEKAPKANPINKLENKIWPSIASGKARKFAVSPLCIGCGTCVRLCPRKNIRLVNGKPEFGTDCLQCLGCLQYCPQEAISIGSITTVREHYHNANITAEQLRSDTTHVD